MKNGKIKIFTLFFRVLALLAFNSISFGRSQLADNLRQGKPQTIVAYGTSLTEGGVWVEQLRVALENKYPGLINIINSGKAGMWSTWGVENLDTRVIEKRPDTVFIEFAINDAHLNNHISLPQARANLENMISRIHTANRQVEIILMTMNPPIARDLENRPNFMAYYQMYRDVAKKYKLGLIDHYQNWKRILDRDKTLYMKYVPDGLHPGIEGCQEVITPFMLKSLGF